MTFTLDQDWDSSLDKIREKADEIPDRFEELRNEVGFIIHGHSVDEAPYITHNLQSSISIDNPDPLSVRVFPDEGIAPYALYVILEGVKRNYSGNPFFDRAWRNAQEDIDREVEGFVEWIRQ